MVDMAETFDVVVRMASELKQLLYGFVYGDVRNRVTADLRCGLVYRSFSYRAF